MKCKLCENEATWKAVDSTFERLVPYLCTEHVNEVTEHNPSLFFEKITVENVESENVKVGVSK